MAKTAGSALSWALIGSLALAVEASPVGCVPDEPAGPTLDLQPLLAATGPGVVVPTLESFSVRTEALTSSLEQWRDTMDAGGDGIAERDLAREAWRDAMDVWQEAEVMQIGPAGSSLTAFAGADIRDEIYSWPTVNPCRVDQETVEAVWDDASFFTDNLVNSYGLDAIEHILWAGPDNTCPNQVPINSEGSWDALTEGQLASNRAHYAIAMSAELTRQADGLVDRWNTDFSLTTSYDSDQEALNAVFDALFYIELMTKDRKIAEPLGLGDCQTACGQLVESLPSGTSDAWIAANLRGFRLLFTAGDAPGIEDLLRDAGHGELADDLLLELDGADAAVADLGMPLEEALMSNAGGVTVLNDAVKRVTDLLKGDLATVLALQIPLEAAGDND